MVGTKFKAFFIGLVLLQIPNIASLSTFAQDKQPYKIEIDPANFVAVVDNPYSPRLPGMRWVYESKTTEGLEHVEIEVLKDRREVMGVTTTVVRDTVSVNGSVVEDTYDYYAQDKEGTVWYFGEDSSELENGKVIGKTGSWEAGVDGAQPGIIMFGDPSKHLSETFQQEYYAGKAEDQAIMLNTTGVADVPYGHFDNAVLTYEFTPLNTKSHEFKYYGRGVGEIKSIDLTTGDVETLIQFTAP